MTGNADSQPLTGSRTAAFPPRGGPEAGINQRNGATAESVDAAPLLGRTITVQNGNLPAGADVVLQNVVCQQQQQVQEQQEQAVLSNVHRRQQRTGEEEQSERIQSILNLLQDQTTAAAHPTHQQDDASPTVTVQGLLDQIVNRASNSAAAEQLIRQQLQLQQLQLQLRQQQEQQQQQQVGFLGSSGLAPTSNNVHQDRSLLLSMLANPTGGRQQAAGPMQLLNNLAASQGQQQHAERQNPLSLLEGLIGRSAQRQQVAPLSTSNEATALLRQVMLHQQQQRLQQQQQEEAQAAMLQLLLQQPQPAPPRPTYLPSSGQLQGLGQISQLPGALQQLVGTAQMSSPAGAATTSNSRDLQLLAWLRGKQTAAGGGAPAATPTVSTPSTSHSSQGGPSSSSSLAPEPDEAALSALLMASGYHPQAALQLQQQQQLRGLHLLAATGATGTSASAAAPWGGAGAARGANDPSTSDDGKSATEEGLRGGARPGRPRGIDGTKLVVAVGTVEAMPSDAFNDRNGDGRAKALPTLLVMPSDRTDLSEHQTLLRYQIEVFRAGEEDVATHTRGRNKPVELGQIGVRCRHCKVLPVSDRLRGSVYFPRAVEGFYQAAQNMNSTHLQTGECACMGDVLRQRFSELIANRGNSNGAGRAYWARQARALGLENTLDGIRFIGGQD
jgi:hypothetical protein